MRKYPKYHGQKFDPISKRRFDKYKEHFKWTIENSIEGLKKDEISTIAHNCAYEVLTLDLE